MLLSARKRLSVGTVLAVLGLSAAAAQPIELAQSASDLTLHLQVLDPEGGGSDPMHLLERRLHRGVKPGGKTYHVLIAAYDAKESGTIEQILVTPLTSGELIGAKFDLAPQRYAETQPTPPSREG